VLECSENGVHLFGLLDVVRTLQFGSAQEAEGHLLAHVRVLFQQLGKHHFIFAAEPDLPADLWPAGALDLGLTHCTVMNTRLLPQIADHVWELTTGSGP
jgi:hypothetical protein